MSDLHEACFRKGLPERDKFVLTAHFLEYALLGLASRRAARGPMALHIFTADAGDHWGFIHQTSHLVSHQDGVISASI